jgi:5-enolpyruvylshikimate-3-phosphate synthase
MNIRLIAYASAATLCFVLGWKVCAWKNAADRLKAEEIMQQAEIGAAKAIAKIKVQNTTIRQPLEREVRENTVYVDCRNSPDSMRLLNAALVGSGDSKLPKSDAAK